MNTFGVHSLCTRSTAVHSSMNNTKMKFISSKMKFHFTCENGYFAVDGRLINIRDVSATFDIKTKKAGILNGFSLNLPTQFDDPHFLFQLLNGYIVSYLLV